MAAKRLKKNLGRKLNRTDVCQIDLFNNVAKHIKWGADFHS